MAKVQYMGTGRRKKSVARVRLVPGEGRVIVNNREIETYFGLETLRVVVNQPLVLTETKDKYDVLVNVHGGGLSGQAGAIRHGISRALLKADENFKRSRCLSGDGHRKWQIPVLSNSSTLFSWSYISDFAFDFFNERSSRSTTSKRY